VSHPARSRPPPRSLEIARKCVCRAAESKAGNYTFTLLSATEQPPTGSLTAPVGPIDAGIRGEVVARWNDTYFDNTPFS